MSIQLYRFIYDIIYSYIIDSFMYGKFIQKEGESSKRGGTC